MNEECTEACEARTALCRVMEDYDRAACPWLYPWLSEERPAARRARRLVRILPPQAAPLTLAAA